MNIYEVFVVWESRDVPNYIWGERESLNKITRVNNFGGACKISSSIFSPFHLAKSQSGGVKLSSLPSGNQTNGIQEKDLLQTSEYLTWQKRDWEFPTAKLAGVEASGKIGIRFDEVRYPPLKENIMENSPDHPRGKGKIMWLSCHCQLPLIYSPIYPTGRDFDWSSQAIPSLRDPPSLKEIKLL